MKKVLSSILISFAIFANLLAPISVGVGKNGVEVKKNGVEAEFDGSKESYSKVFSASIISQNDSHYINETLASTDLNIKIDTGLQEKSDTSDVWRHVQPQETGINGMLFGRSSFVNKNAFILKIEDVATSKSGWNDISSYILKDNTGKRGDPDMPVSVAFDYLVRDDMMPNGNNGLTKLEPAKSYKATIYYLACTASGCGDGHNNGESIPGISDYKSFYPIATLVFKTADKINQTIGEGIGSGNTKTVGGQPQIMPACGMFPGQSGTIIGCIAQSFYYVLFVPTSYLFALSGVFFDSTFAYSVQDTSYRSTFVVEGWGLVRDFCNMFFIFILLYVAISTTLGLHGAKTKETIINIVIIGLFINFSLFATQLIIDASNITARVFYNADTIKITEKGVDGAATVVAKVGEGGVIPLSSALVNKVNPQNLILRSKEINNIPDKGGVSATDKNPGNIGVSSFILIVIIASAVNIVGFIVFLSVGMIFIARVIGLWLAMIIAPLAFFTYIMPEEMAGIKMIGWKNWWPETLKLAFLAPIFIFFMYIILKFLELDLISDSANRDVVDVQSGLGFFVATLIPFAFIMILMMKAKKIATDMSGELGQQITSKLSMVGGLALGAATGGGALMGRATVGRLGNVIANSERLKRAESTGVFGAKMLRNIGTSASKGSFDARKTKAGAAFSKETGMDLMGTGTGLGGLVKANEGGFAKVRADKLAERTKRSKELELGEDSKEKQKLNAAEATLKRLEDETSPEIHSLDGKIKARQTDAADKARRATSLQAIVDREGKDKYGNSLATAKQIKEADEARAESIAVDEELQGFKNDKKAIRTGKGIEEKDEHGHPTGKIKYYTDNGKITKDESAKQIKEIERENELAEVEAKEKEAFAATIEADNTYTQAEKEEARKTANDARILANNTKIKHERVKSTHADLEVKNDFGKSMDTVEYEDIHHAKQAYDKENNQRKLNYADYIQKDKLNKVANFISTGGVHSSLGDREAGHKIRMNIQVEKSGSGNHGGANHATNTHEEKPTKKEESHKEAHNDAGHEKTH